MNDKKEKEEKQKIKKYYEINIEGNIPITAKYRVFAVDEEEALEIFETKPHNVYLLNYKVDFKRLRLKKSYVKETLTNLIKKIKNYV